LAYRIHPEQHRRFITTRKGHEKYVVYWNQGLKESEATEKRKTPMYQVKIILSGSRSQIWRRVLVPKDMSLKDYKGMKICDLLTEE
jgi:hypothetical protein